MRSAKQLRALAAPAKPIVKKPRTPEQSERVYGDEAKQVWVRWQPCYFCGIGGYTQICHAKTGGMGRKDGAARTLPMCGPHPVWDCGRFAGMDNGCHNRPHRSEDLLIIAAEYEAKYRAHVEAMGAALVHQHDRAGAP